MDQPWRDQVNSRCLCSVWTFFLHARYSRFLQVPLPSRSRDFCWTRFGPAVPAEQRRCVPFPRGGSGTLRPGQGWARGGTKCPRRFLEPTGGPGMCTWWDTPYLHMLSSNKDLLEQISASQSDLGMLGIWLSWSLSALLVPLCSLVMEQSLPRACRAAARPGGAAAPRGFSLTLFRCQTPLCSQVNAALASHTSQSLWGPSLASRCGRDKKQSSFCQS